MAVAVGLLTTSAHTDPDVVWATMSRTKTSESTFLSSGTDCARRTGTPRTAVGLMDSPTRRSRSWVAASVFTLPGSWSGYQVTHEDFGSGFPSLCTRSVAKDWNATNDRRHCWESPP